MQRQSASILTHLLPAALAVVLAMSILPLDQAHAVGARRYAVPLGLTSGLCDTWAHACELYYALSVSASNGGGEVWATGGVHIPYAASQANSLDVGEGTRLYGGFAGDETSLSQRNPAVNVSILSGDINFDWVPAGNSYHVVMLLGDSSATLVDGFTIQQGYANGGGPYQTFGGGMFISGGAPKVQNVIFVGNYANYGGGLAVVNGASPTLAKLSFSNNGGVQGAGMYMNNSTTSLSNASFTGNLGVLGGGLAVLNHSNAVLNTVTFSGNTAAGLSGMGGGGMFSEISTASLTNVTFIGNGSIAGGGLFNQTSGATLSKVRFYGNSASVDGGGIYNFGSVGSPITLTNVAFSNNSAGNTGGGMFSDSVSTTVTLKNVTFANNTGNFRGGGLYNLNSSLSLTNVTLTGNAGDGGGFYNDGSTLTLKFITASNNSGYGMVSVNSSQVAISNSIFWNNSVGEIFNGLGTIVSFTKGILQGGCAGGFTACSALNKNPKLKALKNNGGFTKTMALASTSPAIDKVACLGVNKDQRGVRRPQGLKCDMGAYEYKP